MKRANSTPNIDDDQELLKALGRIVAEDTNTADVPLSPQRAFEQRVAALVQSQAPATSGEKPSILREIPVAAPDVGDAVSGGETSDGSPNSAIGAVDAASAKSQGPPPAPLANRWNKASTWALPFAAAAALLLWFAVPSGNETEPLGLYELTVSAAVAESRSGGPTEPGAALVIAPPYSPEFVLQPARAIAGNLETRVWVRSNGEVRLWKHQTQVAASGAIKLVLRDTKTLPTRGELVLVVARPGVIPISEPPQVGTSGRGWQQFVRSFSIASSN